MVDKKKQFEEIRERVMQEKVDLKALLKQQKDSLDESIDKLTKGFEELKKVAQK